MKDKGETGSGPAFFGTLPDPCVSIMNRSPLSNITSTQCNNLSGDCLPLESSKLRRRPSGQLKKSFLPNRRSQNKDLGESQNTSTKTARFSPNNLFCQADINLICELCPLIIPRFLTTGSGAGLRIIASFLFSQ